MPLVVADSTLHIARVSLTLVRLPRVGAPHNERCWIDLVVSGSVDARRTRAGNGRSINRQPIEELIALSPYQRLPVGLLVDNLVNRVAHVQNVEGRALLRLTPAIGAPQPSTRALNPLPNSARPRTTPPHLPTPPLAPLPPRP